MIYFSNDSILINKKIMKWNRKWRGRGREGRKRGGKRGRETGGRMRTTDIIKNNQLLM